MKQTESHGQHVSRAALFLTFSRVSLSSFGGACSGRGARWLSAKRWLSEREFVDLLALGQLLPGPNVLNLTVMVGYRFAGWTGAAASVAGYVGWPCLVVIGMGCCTSSTAPCRRCSRRSAACRRWRRDCCSPL